MSTATRARIDRQLERGYKELGAMLAQMKASGPAADDELHAWMISRYGVHIPRASVCPGHVAPFRAFADAYFSRSPVIVWKASRGFGGKSYLLAALGHAEADTLRADITILGGSGEQAARVLEYLQGFAGEEQNTGRRTRYSGGGRVTALMASTASVRGPHPQRMRLDEVDEMTLQIFDAAQGQPMSKGAIAQQTVISSTHHYPDGVMTEVLRRAKAKAWPVYEWCYKETSAEGGWLTAADIETKRGVISEAMWSNEYDLQAPAPESRAINSAAVSVMFDARLGNYQGRLGEYIESEPPERGAKYATGVDWAKSKDYTIIDTLRTDVRPMRRVAWERRGRETWPAMIARLEERMKRYPGKAEHDATGIGGVVDDYQSAGAIGVVLVGKLRGDIFTRYIAAIEKGEIISPMIEWAYGEHLYCDNNALYGTGHPPDSFVGGALAYKTASAKQGVLFG